MINPFYMFIVSNIVILLFLSLQWSTYYQGLSIQLYIFLAINVTISFVIGFFLRKRLKYTFYKIKPFNPNIITLIIFTGIIIDFLYSKEIPLINILMNKGSYYKDINHIPTLYPLVISIDIFFSIYFFYIYTTLKTKKYLYFSLLLLLPLVLNMGRGLLVMTILPSILIYLSSKKIKISLKSFIKSITIFIIVVYLFGYLGDIKSTKTAVHKNVDIDKIILAVGSPTKKYINSNMPSSLFWIYLYIVSPMANLDNTLLHAEVKNSSFTNFYIYNFLPQSIQKKLTQEFKKDKSYLVVDTFNVSTAYALPYVQLGWLGIILFQIILYLFFFSLFIIVYKSKYKVIFLSIFSTMLLISGFSNMLVFDIVFIPLILCVILALNDRIKYKSRKIK